MSADCAKSVAWKLSKLPDAGVGVAGLSVGTTKTSVGAAVGIWMTTSGVIRPASAACVGLLPQPDAVIASTRPINTRNLRARYIRSSSLFDDYNPSQYNDVIARS